MNKKAIVNVPIAPLLTAPIRSAEPDDEALFGMITELVEVEADGWYKIKTPYRYVSHVHESCLLIDEAAVARYEAGEKRRVWRAHADVLKEPKVASELLVCLPLGAEIKLSSSEPHGKWTAVELPDGREGWMVGRFLGPYYGYDESPFTESELRDRVAETAMLYMGTQYRWGGKTPDGIDCSGLTSMCYMMNGVVLYRNANIVEGFPEHRIELGDAKKGDFIFYPGHIMLYLGEGKYIHSTAHAGDDGVVINSLFPTSPAYRADIAEGLKDGRTWFASIF